MINRRSLFCSAGRLLFAVVVCVLWSGRLTAQPEPLSSGRKPSVEFQRLIALDGCPSELRQIIQDGNVEVVYDSEPEFEKAGRGWADFHISVQREFRYDAQVSRKDGRNRVQLTITKMKADLKLTHLVRLPASFQSRDIWQGRILRHEFDHVAVSLDPRALLLLRHLLEHLPPIERALEPKEELTQERLNRFVNEEIERRHSAVVELVRQNNRLLDKVSAHGTRPVPDRPEFFKKLLLEGASCGTEVSVRRACARPAGQRAVSTGQTALSDS